jgi:hypothetical protein
VVTLPLYVMNYIWDGDELSEEQLQLVELETAQFSIHVVGVVFDPFRCGGEKKRQRRGCTFQHSSTCMRMCAPRARARVCVCVCVCV